MSKKTLVLLSIALVVVIVLSVWILLDNTNNGDDCDYVANTKVDSQNYKEVSFPTYLNFITFSVPEDWNVFYNGDPVFVTDLSEFWGRESITASVSSSDRPVTYSDINWEQVDFKLTDGNIIDDNFIETQRKVSGQTVEEINISEFSGIVAIDLLEDKTPSKPDTGGSTYYLVPKIENPKWNLIINKQSLGSDEFEEGVNLILDTLEIGSVN